MTHSISEWEHAARASQNRSDARRAADKTNHKRMKHAGALGVLWGLLIALGGMLANYLTGGGPLW
jgi:hypothetical protein